MTIGRLLTQKQIHTKKKELLAAVPTTRMAALDVHTHTRERARTHTRTLAPSGGENGRLRWRP